MLTPYIQPITLAEVNRDPGVASPAFRTVLDRNTGDDILEGVVGSALGLDCTARAKMAREFEVPLSDLK
jgi:hypothetical protein